MKTMRILILLAGGIMLFSTLSCEDSTFFQGNVDKSKTYLYLKYENPDHSDENDEPNYVKGDDPKISLDKDSTSKMVKIDFDKTFTGEINENGNVAILINNLRVTGEYGNFKIRDVRVEEYDADNQKWKLQSRNESPIIIDGTQNLDVVLAIDVSSSLYQQRHRVKDAAKQFVDKIAGQIKDARIGVVTFADSLHTLKLAEGKEVGTVKSFINNMSFREPNQTKRETRLYEAMIQANEMLKPSKAESKVMFTLTDGGNKGSYKLKDVTDSLETTNSVVKVQSYLIGFAGDADVDKDAVDELAIRGNALYPKDGKEMEKFFDYLSTTVSTVYSLTYLRSPEEVKKPITIRFILQTEQQ